MSTLNKFELNKLIVSMRHNVKQAQIHTLNRLSRLIKTLKNKKATGDLKAKNEKKAERLVNELLTMKKIPIDEIAAFSLSNTKKVDKILSDVESSYRLKALARLSEHKSIAPVVQQFRAKYPSWEKEFSKVLIALKKREKLKVENKTTEPSTKLKVENKTTEPSTKSKKPKTETRNLTEPKQSDSGLRDEDDEESSSEKESNKSESDDESVFPKSNNSLSMTDSIIYSNGNRFSISSDDLNISDITQNQSKNKDSLKKTGSDKKSNVKHSSYKDTIESSEINCDKKQLADGTKKPSKIENVKVDEPNNAEKRKREVPITQSTGKKKIDNFFLACDNQPYKTFEPVIKRNVENDCSDEENSDLDNRSDNYKQNIKNKNKLKPNYNKKPLNDINKFNKNKNSNNKKNVIATSKVNIKKGRFSNKKTEDSTSAKLHPSWEAKKKLSQPIANFQGKKIVFD